MFRDLVSIPCNHAHQLRSCLAPTSRPHPAQAFSPRPAPAMASASSTPTTPVEQPGAGAAGPGAVALTTVADSVDLHELNAKPAGIGTWVLQAHKIQLIEHEYVWQSQPRKGQKLECRLVAPGGVYCQGVIRALPRSGQRGGGVDPAAELKTKQEKFKGRHGMEDDEGGAER